MDCDKVARPAVEHTDVHAMTVNLSRYPTMKTSRCGCVATLCIGASCIINSSHNTSQACFADTVHNISQTVISLGLVSLFTSCLGAVSVVYVSTKVSAT